MMRIEPDPDPFDGLRLSPVRKAKYLTKCQITPGHEIHPGEPFAQVFIEGQTEPLGYGCMVCCAQIRAAATALKRPQNGSEGR